MEIITGTFDEKINGIKKEIREKAEEIYEEIGEECGHNLDYVKKKIEAERRHAVYFSNHTMISILDEVSEIFSYEIEKMDLKKKHMREDEKIKKASELMMNGIPFKYDGEDVIADGYDIFGEEWYMPFDKNGSHATGEVMWSQAASGDWMWRYMYEDGGLE